MPSRIPLIYGAAAFGEANTHAARIHEIEKCQEVVDYFCKEEGYKELDTARAYGLGTSEKYLSRLNLHGARVDTKAKPPYPPPTLKTQLQESLEALGSGIKIRVWFLHAPDRTQDFEKVAEAINELHKEGQFEEFGLSNFVPWEVAYIYTLCKERGWVKPTVYQGGYSMLRREYEAELFPCLRKFNIRFTAYSPLAGGLLANTLNSKDDKGQTGGRFDVSHRLGQMYRERYATESAFKALTLINEAAETSGIPTPSIALRWLQHHSGLIPTDGVILGASSLQQLKDNIKASEEGPLPEDVVQKCEEAWKVAEGKS